MTRTDINKYRSFRDLIILAVLIAVFAVFVSIHEPGSKLLELMEAAEEWRLDEFALLAFITVLGFIWYFTRRVQDANREILERVAVEQSLREQSHRLQEQVEEQVRLLDEILSVSPDHFYVFDRELNYTYANAAGARVLGLSPGRMLGRHWQELGLAPGVMKPFEHQVRHVFKHGLPVKKEMIFPTVDGTRRFDYVLSPLFERSSGVRSVVCTVRDITDHLELEEELRRHRDHLEEIVKERAGELRNANENLQIEMRERELAQEAMKASEEKYRTLVEKLPAVTYVAALDPGRTIQYISPQVAQFIGFKAEDVLSHKVLLQSLLYPEDKARVLTEMAESLTCQKSFVSEYRVTGKSGQLVWVRDEATVVRDASGSPAFIQGIMFDITDRKRAEEEQRRLEERMEHAQRLESLQALAGGMAHDFNNMLQGIIGTAELAAGALAADDPVYEDMQEIRKTASQAAELTCQLMAYTGKSSLQSHHLDLSDLVHKNSSLLESALSKNARISYQLTKEKTWIEGDASQLRQALLNLAVNASEAIGEKAGTIKITTGIMSASDSELAKLAAGENLRAGTFAFLEVADTGSGMTETIKSRIFAPFFSTKFVGRGLGLSAVQGIIKAHGGGIFVDSAPGAGARIRLLLPLVAETAVELAVFRPAETAQLEETVDEKQGKVLLVDDERLVRRTIERILTRAGYEVVTACDGIEGVEAFGKEPENISIVILDLTMPRMGGVQAFHEFRKLRPNVPILLSSGYSEHDAKSQFADQESVEFIQKPYDGAALLDKVRIMLSCNGRVVACG